MGHQLSREQLQEYQTVTQSRFDDRELRHLYKIFHRVANNEGKLSPIEFKRYIDSLGIFQRLDQGEYYEHLFRAYDRNADGVVDFKEFLEYHLATLYQSPGDDLFLDVIFRMYDCDQTGFITQQNMIAVITSSTRWLGYCDVDVPEVQQSIDQTVKQLLWIADVDGDGKISRADLKDASAKVPELLIKLRDLG